MMTRWHGLTARKLVTILTDIAPHMKSAAFTAQISLNIGIENMLNGLQHTFNKPLTIDGVLVPSCVLIENETRFGLVPCDQYGRERSDISFTDSSCIRFYRYMKNLYKD